MLSKAALLTLAAALVEATPQGFNYGSTRGDGSAFQQSDFEGMFKTAQSLPGASGFDSARLYTMMQGGTTTQVISAVPAAISTKTNLLLGMWVSDSTNDDDDTAFNNEMNVLKSAISQYGDQIKNLVVGISVGSEDLYRISPTGLSSPNSGPGKSPKKVSDYINSVKSYLSSTPLSGVPVGHVDTWTAWVNGTNSPVIDSADFLGVDAYPYWQSTEANGIENAQSLFNEALHNTQGASNGKQVWITETGWPVQGKDSGAATANTNNAQSYWQSVGCPNFGKTPTFWYTVIESPTSGNPDFSVYNPSSNQPYFDLSCSNVQSNTDNSNSTSSATSSAAATTGTSTGSSGSGSGSGSGASNGTYTSGSPASPSSSGTGSSGSGSGSSGSGSSGSGSGSSGSGSTSGSASSPSGSVSTAGAATMGVYSVGSLIAFAAVVAAFL